MPYIYRPLEGHLASARLSPTTLAASAPQSDETTTTDTTTAETP